MMPPKKLAVFLLCSLVTFFAEPGFAFDEQTSTEKLQQTALVFNRSAMPEMLQSSAIRAPGLPLIFSSQIRLACMSVPAWKGDILAYLPETSSCIPFAVLSNTSQRVFKLETGRDDRIIDTQNVQRQLLDSAYQVVRVSAPAASFELLLPDEAAAGVCSCPGNAAPIVSLDSGGAQQVTINTNIGDIVFSASDQDSEVLFDSFSYQLNGGGVIDGLPASLSKNCSSGVGTLGCTVSGVAPGTAGSYNIILDVSDGFNTRSRSTSLTVSEPVNVAPSVNLVSGDSQQVNINTSIGNIVFSATDVDSVNLTDSFSYEFNGGLPTAGLPSGLIKNCTTGSGTLDCTVNGTAPGATGTYNIILSVSDEANTTVVSADLTVNDPTNIAPVVSLDAGDAQEVLVEEAIAEIIFSATDADSNILTDSFTYNLNDGAGMDGLPVGLSKVCSSGSGTLSCSITGNAPSIAGVYTLVFDVSDGFNTRSQSTSLTVSEPVNVAPLVNLVSGGSQQVNITTPVGNIEFSATDIDSVTLTDSFSYQFNGGSSNAGLPSGLVKNCIAGSGTLDCTVSGTAPGTPGAYEIMLSVSDEVNTSAVSTDLTVSDPTNIEPVVSLDSGDAQQVHTDETIAEIIFSATDVDSDILTDAFSYNLNDGAAINGLPAGLSTVCNSGIGTLNCAVSGNAPSVIGVYTIVFDVSDEINTISEAAELTVIGIDPPLPESIFKDGFEGSP
jgi:hypothetical protein